MLWWWNDDGRAKSGCKRRLRTIRVLCRQLPEIPLRWQIRWWALTAFFPTEFLTETHRWWNFFKGLEILMFYDWDVPWWKTCAAEKSSAALGSLFEYSKNLLFGEKFGRLKLCFSYRISYRTTSLVKLCQRAWNFDTLWMRCPKVKNLLCKTKLSSIGVPCMHILEPSFRWKIR